MKLGPHRQHYFQLENVEGQTFTHVRVTIYPDGGIKRVRLIGRRADMSRTSTAEPVNVSTAAISAAPEAPQTASQGTTTIPALPLTPEAFAPFGQVIQAYGDHNARPKGIRVTPANGGTASKFHKLSLLTSSYSPDAGATTGISVYRCQPLTGVAADGTVELTTLERHPFTNQTFIPMGHGSGEGLNETADKYLVVVAKNGEDGRPDLETTRAFIATTAQGVVYNTAVWRKWKILFGPGDDL
jgi:allantoicase